MKKRRLKSYVLPTTYLLITITIFTGILFMSNKSGALEEYNFSTGVMKEEVKPVVETENNDGIISSPVDLESVKISVYYYSKDDDKDSLTINKKKKCFIVDVTEDEKNSLSTIQALNGGTYEKIDENFTKNDEVETKFSEYEQKIEERDNSISTLTTERDTAEANYTEAQTTIQNLNEELDALKEYKLNTENEEKQTIIDKYSEQLDETIIDKYTEKISEYTIADLEKDLAFELVQANPSIFTANPQGRIPKDTPKSGLEAILEKYVK